MRLLFFLKESQMRDGLDDLLKNEPEELFLPYFENMFFSSGNAYLVIDIIDSLAVQVYAALLHDPFRFSPGRKGLQVHQDIEK
jgi:hypothetical protein